MKKILIGSIGLMAMTSVSLTQAASLDFTGLGFNAINVLQVSVPGATVDSLGDGFFVNQFDQFGTGSICGLSGNSCEADFRITFTSAVSNLMFRTFGADPGDSVTITAFNGATSLGSTVVTTDTVVNLAALGSITSVFFDDSSSAAGIGYANFTFDPGTTVVPLPASLPLLAAGLGIFGFLRRRKAG